MNLNQTSVSLAIGSLLAIAYPAVIAADGLYIGAAVGRSAATIDDARINAGLIGQGLTSSSISNDERDTGYKLFGGYQVNRNFGVEGGYFDLGHFGYTARTVPTGSLTGDIRVRGLNLDLVGTLPLTDRFSVLGRVGVQNSRVNGAFASSGAVRMPFANANPSERSTGYKVGVGLAYALTESLSVRGEAERYRIKDSLGNSGHIDLLSVALVYSFGARPAPPTVYAPRPVTVAAAPPPPAPPPAPIAAPAPTPPPPVVAAPPAPAPMVPIKVSLSADSLFDFDKSVIKPAGLAALDRLAAELRGAKIDAARVTGHTDRLGPKAYNLTLSEQRADAVRAYLVQSGGIPADRVSTQGVNGANPVTRPGDCVGNKPTPALIACLQPDRRVEVEITGTR